MGKTFLALLIKAVITFAAAWVAFAFFSYTTYGFIITLAIVATVVNYIIGDVILLPRVGNVTAAIADGGLSILVAYAVSGFRYAFGTTLNAIILFGVLTAVVELFYHVYLVRYDVVEPVSPRTNPRHHTAFSNEMGEDVNFNHRDDHRDDID